MTIKNMALIAMITSIISSSVFAKDNSGNVESGVYGKVIGDYTDSTTDWDYKQSHLNSYVKYNFTKKTNAKIDVGARYNKLSPTSGSDDYSLYVDEAFYQFTENRTSSITFGRFFNPIGLYGEVQRNFKEHPFTVRESFVSNVDGVQVNYIGQFQKNVFFNLNVFAGTSFSDTVFNNQSIDLDAKLNYGVNLKVASSLGIFSVGGFASNNGDGLMIDDEAVNKGTSITYQLNAGYEYTRNNVYVLIDLNKIAMSYELGENTYKDSADIILGYKVRNLMPMIGYSYVDNKDFFSDTNKDSFKAIKTGLRMEVSKVSSILVEYNYIKSNDGKNDEQLVTAGLTFNF